MATDDPGEAELEQQFLLFMGRHLVALVGAYQELENGQPRGPERAFLVSGFVLDVHGEWRLATAGHLFHGEDRPAIGDLVRAGRIRVNRWRLADYFGPTPAFQEATPFDFDMESVSHLHNSAEALDFALIPLRPFYRASLERNHIEPIPRVNWIGSDQVEFRRYAMLGVPHQGPSENLDVEISPTLIWVERLTEIPEGIIPPAPGWFVGQIRVPFSIEGMSGGPIFGFYQLPDGRWAYRVIAIQSGWFSTSQVTTGCPIPRFMALVDAEIDRHLPEGGESVIPPGG